ncbi:DUF5682 family protein [Escherichia coli]
MRPPGVVPGRHLLNFRRSGRRYKPAGRIQAQTYFIDLPCWAQSEEEDDSPDTQDESQTLLLRDTRMDNSDTLWDHLFEDESQQTALPSALARYFAQLPGDSAGDALNRQREAFMARWITWAMQQNNGDVLVVCGGWHAPALANMWRECRRKLTSQNCPHWRMPLQVVISHPTVKSALMCWQDTFPECLPGLAKLVLAVSLTAGR